MRLYIYSFLVSFICLSVNAQRGVRVGYIDMDYILENVGDYNEAKSQLENKVVKWKGEIDALNAEVDLLKNALESEKVLLTKELVEEREEDIYFKEKEVSDYQQKRFGPAGDLVKQKQRLIQPIQDQVFNAVQEIAKNKKYDFILDKSADLVMLYSADRYDISDLVLRIITRSAKRQQLKGKGAKRALENDEDNSLEVDKELQERKAAAEAKLAERERLIEEKRAAREKLRQEKIKEYEDRRNKLLEARKRKRDSILEAKKNSKQ